MDLSCQVSLVLNVRNALAVSLMDRCRYPERLAVGYVIGASELQDAEPVDLPDGAAGYLDEDLALLIELDALINDIGRPVELLHYCGSDVIAGNEVGLPVSRDPVRKGHYREQLSLNDHKLV